MAVLPGLDPTTMGWKQRAWYLPAAAADSFDTAGNGGPTIWVDGRIVGAWAQTRAGEIQSHYFERVAAGRRDQVEARTAELKALDRRRPVHRPVSGRPPPGAGRLAIRPRPVRPSELPLQPLTRRRRSRWASQSGPAGALPGLIDALDRDWSMRSAVRSPG